MHDKIIITAANSKYYDSLLTLISSIHKNNIDLIEKIVVYNIGLSNDEIFFLSSLKKVQVIIFSEEEISQHSKFLDGGSHVYKCYSLYHASKISNYFLWIDAGAMFLKDYKIIFDILDKDDIFLVGDSHLNHTYTHSKCKEITKATDSELLDKHLSSGIIGFKSIGMYQKMIEDCFNYSMIEGCCDGDYENHRHDQSILSILASRYKCPRQDIDLYGYWTDINRNLKTATEKNAIIFVHRRGHIDKEHLLYEN